LVGILKQTQNVIKPEALRHVGQLKAGGNYIDAQRDEFIVRPPLSLVLVHDGEA